MKEKLDKLNTSDIYSLILFALYKAQNLKEYSTLSELAYVLDRKSFLNLLEHFGGITIKIPTINEFSIMVNALLIYQYVNIENNELDEALKLIKKSDHTTKEIKDAYFKLCGVLDYHPLKSRSPDV